MRKFTSKTYIRLLLAINLLTATILITVVVREKYPLKVYQKLFSEWNGARKEYNYLNNGTYHLYTTVYPLYQGQKNIIMLGNSLTSFANWSELLNRPDAATRGIGGDITAGFIGRLNYIIDIKPKICFIEGGVNDLIREIQQDTIIKNLTTIIDVLQANDIKAVLTTVTLVTEQCIEVKNPAEFNQKVNELNRQISQLAKTKDVKLIDLNQYIANANFLNFEYATGDGIHFTGEVYSIWKREVETILEQENI